MFAVCKTLSTIILAGWASIAFGHAAGEYEIMAGDCSDASECVVFFKNKAGDKLCDSSDFSATWTQGTDKYLVQCRSVGTDEDNVVWVVDSTTALFARLNYGRFMKKNALEKTTDMEIPDRFRFRSLCNPIDMTTLKASDFVLLYKKPSDKGENPYCYAPIYLTLRAGKLIVDAGGGPVKSSDPDYAVHSVPPQDKERLNYLLDRLRQWRPH